MNWIMKVVAFVAVGGALAIAGRETEKNERARITTTYQLGASEMTAYDSCRKALNRKVLKNGGDKSDFCGCFAKRATGKLNAEHKSVAGRFLGVVVGASSSTALSVLKPETYKGLASSEVEVFEDITAGFTSCIAEVNPSCDKNDATCQKRRTARLERNIPAQR